MCLQLSWRENKSVHDFRVSGCSYNIWLTHKNRRELRTRMRENIVKCDERNASLYCATVGGCKYTTVRQSRISITGRIVFIFIILYNARSRTRGRPTVSMHLRSSFVLFYYNCSLVVHSVFITNCPKHVRCTMYLQKSLLFFPNASKMHSRRGNDERSQCNVRYYSISLLGKVRMLSLAVWSEQWTNNKCKTILCVTFSIDFFSSLFLHCLCCFAAFVIWINTKIITSSCRWVWCQSYNATWSPAIELGLKKN